jgi:hypothetical protein
MQWKGAVFSNKCGKKTSGKKRASIWRRHLSSDNDRNSWLRESWMRRIRIANQNVQATLSAANNFRQWSNGKERVIDEGKRTECATDNKRKPHIEIMQNKE